MACNCFTKTVLKKGYCNTITFCGQAAAQLPQAVHFSGSMWAKKCCTVTAPAGHFLAQRPQPMQLTAQPFFAAGPFCVLPQTTRACFLPAGCRLSTPRGQTATHLPQPTQFSLKTLTSPFCTCKPLNSQAVTQSPRPKQLFWQSFCPPNAAAAAQEERPV